MTIHLHSTKSSLPFSLPCSLPLHHSCDKLSQALSHFSILHASDGKLGGARERGYYRCMFESLSLCAYYWKLFIFHRWGDSSLRRWVGKENTRWWAQRRSQHQVPPERPCGAQWTGQWRSLLLFHPTKVSISSPTVVTIPLSPKLEYGVMIMWGMILSLHVVLKISEFSVWLLFPSSPTVVTIIPLPPKLEYDVGNDFIFACST